MRLMLASFTGLIMLILSGCAGNATVTTPFGNGSAVWTGSDPAQATITDTSRRVLYAPGQTHDVVSGRALFANAGTRSVGGDCAACRADLGVRAVAGTVNPCAPTLEVKPSLRERVRNIFMFRSPHYVREIRNGGDTPVTRVLKSGY